MAPYWEMLAQECLQRNDPVCRWWHACQGDNLMSSLKNWLFFISGFLYKALVAPFHTLVLTGLKVYKSDFSWKMCYDVIFYYFYKNTSRIYKYLMHFPCFFSPPPVFKFTPIIPPSSRLDQCCEHSRASLFCGRDWSWPFPLNSSAIICPRVVKMFILCFSC